MLDRGVGQAAQQWRSSSVLQPAGQRLMSSATGGIDSTVPPTYTLAAQRRTASGGGGGGFAGGGGGGGEGGGERRCDPFALLPPSAMALVLVRLPRALLLQAVALVSPQVHADSSFTCYCS